jgi:hypothetical protein
MHKSLDLYQNQSIWPFFRTMFVKPSLSLPYGSVSIIEPAYYWRIERDYFMNHINVIPKPYLLSFYNNENAGSYAGSGNRKPFISVKEIEDKLFSSNFINISRIVLQVLPFTIIGNNEKINEINNRTSEWALDSVGKFKQYEEEVKFYELLPKLTTAATEEFGHQNDFNQKQSKTKDKESLRYPMIGKNFMKETRLCETLFRFDNGNRSCFNKCR